MFTKLLPIRLIISLSSILSNCAGLQSYAAGSCHPTHSRLGDDSFWVEVSKYGTSTTKSLIIVPPTGGTNFIDRSYAEKFCEAGYEVYILNNWLGQTEKDSFDLGLHQRFYERAEKAIGLAIAEVKSPFIGLLGTSVGALHSAVAASTKDRLNAVFIIVGGASLAEIIVNSDQSAMVDLGKKRMSSFGYKSKNEYLKALASNIKLEPMKLGSGFKNKKLGVVIALEDTTVPTEFQKKLADYWQPQTLIEKNNGHFWAIVNTWLHSTDRILEFFETALKQPKT